MQYRRLLLSLIVGSLACASIASAREPIHVFILAGQSNAVGRYVSSSSLPSGLRPAESDVLFWYEEGGNVSLPRIHSGNDFVPLDSQSDSAGITFGTSADPINNGYASEITAARDLLDDIGGKIAFIKFAFGASGIKKDWSPSDGGSLFWELIDITDDAAAELRSRGYDAVFSGFFWMQGEYDAEASPRANKYKSRLRTFVNKMRTELGAPDLKFVIARLHDDMDLSQLDTIRAAQEDIAAEDALNFMVNTDNLSLRSDDLHYLGGAQRKIGNRLASLGVPDEEPSPTLELAPLSGGKMVWGRYISGNLSSVQATDSSDVVVESRSQGNNWLSGIQVGATSPHLTIDQLRVHIRVEVDEGPVTAGALAYNFDTSSWDVLSFFSFDTANAATLTLDVSNPNSYVSGSGTIGVRVLSMSDPAQLPAGHEFRIDQIEVQVRAAS